MLISPDSTWAQWPLGRVIEVYPGKDDHVRTAKLQVGEKQYVRPISQTLSIRTPLIDISEKIIRTLSPIYFI